MRKFIIASHGGLAEGLRDTIEMIIGKQDNIKCFSFYSDSSTNENKEKEEAKDFIEEHSNKEIIVFTDLMGGSVNQFFISLLSIYDFKLFSGVNLPLILEVILNANSTCSRSSIDLTINTATENLVFVNQTIEKLKKMEDE